MRKGRSEFCDRMRFRVEEGSWPSIRKSSSAYRAGWRHRHRQAVTTKLGDPHFLLAHQLPCPFCNAGLSWSSTPFVYFVS